MSTNTPAQPRTLLWNNFGDARTSDFLPVPVNVHASPPVRNGSQGYNSSNTRWNGYIYHSFGQKYRNACIVWAIGFTNANSNFRLFAREYAPGTGNNTLASAIKNPYTDTFTEALGPFHPNARFQSYTSPIFAVTPGNIYELGLERLPGNASNARLYSAMFIFFPS